MNIRTDFDIGELISDREKFNSFVYTPADIAISELKKRRDNEELKNKILSLLNSNIIPEPFIKEPRATLFRQVITPNYELRRFVSIADALGIKPLFWEYHADKFVPKNEIKYYLGMMAFSKGRGKRGGLIRDYKGIIDFNSSNGKKLSDIKTLWGDDLISFHHSLFNNTYRKVPQDYFFDASNWLKSNGGTAIDYYKAYLALFVYQGILFENIMLDTKELSFTRDIFLPAFIEIKRLTGFKPLIIALEPTDIETDEFWMCHPYESKRFIERKLNKNKIVKKIKSFILNLWT